MFQNIVSNTSDNRETNKPSQLIRVTKWLFWITVCLYIVHIFVSYYLDWKYPVRYNYALEWYMYFLGILSVKFWYLTLGMVLISIIAYFRTRNNASRVSIGSIIVIIAVILFTIFGYQGVNLDRNGTREYNCPACGRPFWSRGFFFKKNREAKKSNTTSWATIKK